MSRPLPPNQALSTSVVSNLVGGVSKRADAVRNPNQVTEMINASPNWSEGLKRRPRTSFLIGSSQMDSFDPTDGAFLHTYNRDTDEKYAVLITDGNLSVVSIAEKTQAEIFSGTNIEKTVGFTDGNDGNVKLYLAASNPQTAFKAITVGDKTFIVNSEITVAVDASATSPAVDYEGMIWVRLGDYGSRYSVTLDSVDYGFTSSQTHRRQIDTANMALALKQLIPQGQNNTTIQFSGVFKAGETMTLTDTISGKTNTTTIIPAIDPDEPDQTKITLNGVTIQGTGFFTDAASAFHSTLGNPWYPIIISDNTLLITGLVAGNFNFTCTTTSAHGGITVTNSGTLANTYVCTLSGSYIHVKRANDADFTLVPTDGLGGQAIEVIKGTIQLFEDLPVYATEGFTVQVVGDPTTPLDDYFVQFTGGSWVETLKGGEEIALDPATMPHVLTRNSDGTFTFAEAPWSNRLVGSVTTNPFPSLVGQTISDLFYFKTRLGYAAGINVVMSQVNSPYNLFRQTVASLLDEDVIDISVALEKTSAIFFTTPTSQDLLLWTDLGQESVEGEQLLTPKTVNALPASNYATSLRVKPVRLGNSMYYAVDRKTTTGIFEYQTVLQNGQLVGRQAIDITEEIASYLKGLPVLLMASDSGKTLVLATDDDDTILYICTIIGEGDRRLYSWHKWDLGVSLTTADLMDNKLVMVVDRDNQFKIESLVIEPAATDIDLNFQVHLDSYIELITGTYTAP